MNKAPASGLAHMGNMRRGERVQRRTKVGEVHCELKVRAVIIRIGNGVTPLLKEANRDRVLPTLSPRSGQDPARRPASHGRSGKVDARIYEVLVRPTIERHERSDADLPRLPALRSESTPHTPTILTESFRVSAHEP